MLEYKLGYFATSLCGHDKGKVYMIVKQEGEMIGLMGEEEPLIIRSGKRRNIFR